MRQVALALCLAALLSACTTPVSVADVRKSGEGSSKTTVAMPYEDVYRIIAREARRCYTRTISSAASTSVASDLYASSKTGEVSIIAGLVDTSVAEIVWDIKATGDKTTEVTSSYRKKSTESVDKAMQAWLKGDTKTCTVAT